MLAAGLLVVLISGGIDISFTATASVAQYVAITYANAVAPNQPLIGWLGVVAIGAGLGTALGFAECAADRHAEALEHHRDDCDAEPVSTGC